MKNLHPAPEARLNISWPVLFSYLTALIANALPVPSPWALLIPPFGLLLLFYWAMEDLQATHFVSAVVLGLLYDALYDTLLGVHAVIFSLALFLLLKIRVPLRLASPLQQAFVLMPILWLYQLASLFLVQPMLEGDEWFYFAAMPLTLLIFWPVIRLTAERLFGFRYRRRTPV